MPEVCPKQRKNVMQLKEFAEHSNRSRDAAQKHLTRSSIVSRMKSELGYRAVPIGIDISGLGTADQARIMQIGFWQWMDEIAGQSSKKKPSRYSLEYRQAQMKRRERTTVRRGRKVAEEG
jgi:hypothetical protein